MVNGRRVEEYVAVAHRKEREGGGVIFHAHATRTTEYRSLISKCIQKVGGLAGLRAHDAKKTRQPTICPPTGLGSGMASEEKDALARTYQDRGYSDPQRAVVGNRKWGKRAVTLSLKSNWELFLHIEIREV